MKENEILKLLSGHEIHIWISIMYHQVIMLLTVWQHTHSTKITEYPRTMVAEHDTCLYYLNSAEQSKRFNQSSNIPGTMREGQSEGKSLEFRRRVDSRDTSPFMFRTSLGLRTYSLAGNSHRRTGTKTEVRWSKGSADKQRKRTRSHWCTKTSNTKCIQV